MAKHTPGPWQWYWRVENGEANCGVFYEEHKGVAYSICRAPRYETAKQWEANARLIVASPLLLVSLREALKLITPGSLASEVRERAEATIRAATHE
jgi:hypothetical protein